MEPSKRSFALRTLLDADDFLDGSIRGREHLSKPTATQSYQVEVLPKPTARQSDQVGAVSAQ